jgi:hypothetical protein
MCSFFYLGVLVIISNSHSSYAKLIAGNISVPIEIQRTKIVDKGNGI